MAEHGALWQWILEALSAQQPVALLVVADSAGSSPGKIGDKMAVTADRCMGTIGGGAIEAELLSIARTLLADADARPQLHRRIHHPTANGHASGMICGGEQTVLAYPCPAEERFVFEQCLESCWLRTPLVLSISAQGLRIVQPSESGPTKVFSSGEDWQYLETLGPRKRAYIIGGGHVSLALSRVLDGLDFDITVIDEREQPEAMQMNGYARQKWRIPYSDVAGHIPEGGDIFVFIMTHSHHADEVLAASLAKKQFAYLGLLGSTGKITQFKASLARQLSTEQLQKLHAPMGLPIKSHTPAEIAISIAAELIQIINASR